MLLSRNGEFAKFLNTFTTTGEDSQAGTVHHHDIKQLITAELIIEPAVSSNMVTINSRRERINERADQLTINLLIAASY